MKKFNWKTFWKDLKFRAKYALGLIHEEETLEESVKTISDKIKKMKPEDRAELINRVRNEVIKGIELERSNSIIYVGSCNEALVNLITP